MQIDAVNQQERPVEISKEWVAGLLVGEGHFGLSVQKTPYSKTRGGFCIVPCFALHMKDEETMFLVIDAFKGWDLKHYVENPTRINGRRVSAKGGKQVRPIIIAFLPWLTGSKLQAARTVLEFIDSRRSHADHKTGYTEHEAGLVNKLRSINGGNFKNKNLLESPTTIRRARA